MRADVQERHDPISETGEDPGLAEKPGPHRTLGDLVATGDGVPGVPEARIVVGEPRISWRRCPYPLESHAIAA